MPPGARSLGYLGDLATQLQRYFGFDGDANARLSTEAVPVVIMGDAGAPGYGDQRARRFTAFSGIAAGSMQSFLATQDVIITQVRMQVTNAAAGSVLMSIGGPAFVPPGVPAQTGIFLDRQLDNELAPLLGSNGAPVGGSRSINNYQIAAGIALQPLWVLCDQPFLLAAGRSLNFNCSLTNVTVELWGRTF